MEGKPYALIAIFDTPGALVLAAENVRDAGYVKWDCITPFQVQGLDEAMGDSRSTVPRYSLLGGIIGFCSGMLLVWFVNRFDYPIVVGGKPLFSPLFALPISYVLTVLFAAFATVGGMLFVNGLPMYHHPVLDYENIRRGTDDLFFIVIEKADQRYDLERTSALLAKLGGTQIKELLEIEKGGRAVMRYLYLTTALVMCVAVSILGFRGRTFMGSPMDVFPEWLFPGMKQQPRLTQQMASEFFSDGRLDRVAPPGTVPSSFGPAGQPLKTDRYMYQGRLADGSFGRRFPAAVHVDMKLLRRGRDRFTIYCSPCHGALGDGNGIMRKYGMGAIATYHTDRIRGMPEGEIFNTITNGKGQMNPYGDKLEPADRWAVIAYLRALQRAQTGTLADVPSDHREDLGLK